jgi:hypothetical protein
VHCFGCVVRRVLLLERDRGVGLRAKYWQTGPRRSCTGWMAHDRATPDRSIDVVVEVSMATRICQWYSPDGISDLEQVFVCSIGKAGMQAKHYLGVMSYGI